MKLAFLVEQAFAPVPGGTGRYARELAKALLRETTGDRRVDFYAAWHRQIDLPDLSVKRLPLPRRGLIAAWDRGLPPWPRGAHVVHAPTLLAPTRNGPLVVTIHDAVPWHNPETLTPRGARWHRGMAERVVAHGAHIAVPTHAVAADLVAVLPGLGADRIHVLGAGTTPALSAEPDPEFVAQTRAELELPERFVLSVATLEPRKGLDVLLDSLAELGSSAPTLVLVGQPGWGGLDIDGEVARRSLPPERIRQLGAVPDQQLAVLLRLAGALVMPSRGEGFGLPLLEAMSVGTPAICSDLPALMEVGGDAALFVNSGDPAVLASAIVSVLDDAEDGTAARVAAGLVRAKAFNWGAVADRAWTLYQRLC
jgi:glycosyltransferase involved in cell wall biosynthesis